MIVIKATLYRCRECHTVVAEEAITPCGPCPNCKINRGWDELIVRDNG